MAMLLLYIVDFVLFGRCRRRHHHRHHRYYGCRFPNKAMKWKRMCNLNCHTVETVCRIKCTRCLALALALALSMHKPTRFYANTICNIIIIFDASSTATPLKIISSKLCYIYFVFHLQSTPIPSRVEYDFFGNLLVSRCWHAVYGVRCWKI